LDEVSKKSFRLLKKIKDPKFDIDRLEFYSLSLFIGSKDFQILISDSETKQCLLLEDYVFNSRLKDSELATVIKLIFEDHHLVLANFWKVINLVIKNRSFSFVPEKIFQEQKISIYLNVHSFFSPIYDEVMLTYHRQLDFVNVFTVPRSLVTLTNEVYPGKSVQFIHQSSTLINGAIAQNKIGQKDVFIYIDRFGLHIVVVNDKKLIFYNQYEIKKFSDYVKFIKMAATELDFDITTSKIMLYGYIGKNTRHFEKLKETMSQLTFGSRPQNLRFSFVFDEVAEHQYFDLFSTETIRF